MHSRGPEASIRAGRAPCTPYLLALHVVVWQEHRFGENTHFAFAPLRGAAGPTRPDTQSLCPSFHPNPTGAAATSGTPTTGTPTPATPTPRPPTTAGTPRAAAMTAAIPRAAAAQPMTAGTLTTRPATTGTPAPAPAAPTAAAATPPAPRARRRTGAPTTAAMCAGNHRRVCVGPKEERAAARHVRACARGRTRTCRAAPVRRQRSDVSGVTMTLARYRVRDGLLKMTMDGV